MLNKVICQKCINESYSTGWNDIHQFHWGKGVVWCIVSIGNSIKIAEDPPVECPYYLEQVMSDVE